jgi:hypothetical protein
MNVEILEWAENDLELGRIFYEKREPGIGEYFLDSISADIESLALYGGIHRRIGAYFRSLSHIFPYAIYYTVEDELVRV